MIPTQDFLPLIAAAIPRFGTNLPNQRQQICIRHRPATPLMIGAGPGSGKTTVLVLRALRLVFVDGLLPENIVLTTFTRKAAAELRARLIEWGMLIVEHLKNNPPPNAQPDFRTRLDAIDINRFLTGTLDSICEEILRRFRNPGDPAPVLVEGFVGNALLMYEGLFPQGATTNPQLQTYLGNFTFDGAPPRNFAEKLAVSRTILDRLIHDRVDLASYGAGQPHGQARTLLVNALRSYKQFMSASNRMDFAGLEEMFLERLSQNRLARFTAGVRALLVDEYQDTNPLQESIYFELIRLTGASFTIVGDDDQSLYRFRGATVELFRDFITRFHARIPTQPRPALRYLVDNYRSTPEIVEYFNNFIRRDTGFAPARVQPLKPLIIPQMPANGIPVMGMFRGDCPTLAKDLASFLTDVFRGTGRTITVNGQDIPIIKDPVKGDFGDCVLLSHTVLEFGSRWGNNPPRERLPRLLRIGLEGQGVSVFNPRGRTLRDIPQVQQLLGLLLECIDPPAPGRPQGTITSDLITNNQLRREAQNYLAEWRASAQAFVGTNPLPRVNHTLSDFVQAWQARRPQAAMDEWPQEWPILELCFKFMSWIPFLRDNPEGQVYLEAITRCIAQAATFSSYRSTIVFYPPPHDNNSVRRAIVDVLAPIAEGAIDVDEEILPSVPRSSLQIMTIHQAKGLEFPLVIVDVSSDYATNSPKNRFRRFPENPSSVQFLEDDLAPHCEIGPLRQGRLGLSRAFDDLIRLYYVSYSRPQSALLLIGVDPCLRYSTSIKHVATGWNSDGSWPWITPVPGRHKPPLANNIPIHLI